MTGKPQPVWITCEGRRVEGDIVLSSGNRQSLMLAFDAMLAGHLGMMPVLQGDDGVYRTILGEPVEVGVEPREG